jgi:hypothetical protein
MKIRIKGNSIRLRLSQGDVAEFAKTGKVEERTEFGASSQSFFYLIAAESDAEKISARFENGRISITIPQAVAENWRKTEETGISGEQELPTGKTLRILIEKDFACLAPRADEDESDNFPHPKFDKIC